MCLAVGGVLLVVETTGDHFGFGEACWNCDDVFYFSFVLCAVFSCVLLLQFGLMLPNSYKKQ